MRIMHETDVRDYSWFSEKTTIGPRPEFCPDCQSRGLFSKLELSFIGLSSGIWMCSDVKCNFPLNSEDLQVYIEEVDPFHDTEVRHRKNKLKKMKQCAKCKNRRRPCDINCISAPEDSSLIVSKTVRKTRKAIAKHCMAQSAASYIGQNPLPVFKRKEKAEWCANQVDQNSEIGELPLVLEKGCPSKTSSDRKASLQSSKNHQFRHTENGNDINELKLLAKYRPFTSKREIGIENGKGFVIVESKVLPAVDESVAGVKKDNGVEECYDSAYSSPASDELNFQQQDFSSFLHLQNPVFESALKMIDSMFDNEAKIENCINTVCFENFDILGDDVDLSKFC